MRMSRALRCSSHGCSTTAANPSRARPDERVDVGVLVAHRAHLGAVGLGAAGLDGREQHRPVEGVLGAVVVVQGGGEPRPARGRGPATCRVAERGRPHRRRERREVTAERVVHDVHAGLVVRTLGDVGLAGKVELRAVGRGRRVGWSSGSPRVVGWVDGRAGPAAVGSAGREPPCAPALGPGLGGGTEARAKRGSSQRRPRQPTHHRRRNPPCPVPPAHRRHHHHDHARMPCPTGRRPWPPRRRCHRTRRRSSSSAAPA